MIHSMSKKKFFLNNGIVFLLTLFLSDILLSLLLPKDVYEMINHNIGVEPLQISRKQRSDVELYNNYIPYWEAEYRWPYFGFKTTKNLQCRVLWIWDSIIRWSWVSWDKTYFKLLSNYIKNTEWINNGVPWHDTLQSIVKFEEWDLYKDADLLIWHFWEDDNHIYKLIDWVLYDSKITINEFWKPYLFWYQKLDTFLLKYSFLYNKILEIKMKWEMNKFELDNEDYILYELSKVYQDFLHLWNNKKILIIFSPSLLNNSYKWEKWWDSDGYPYFYKKIEKKFSWVNNIKILYLDTLFKWVDPKDIRYDTCCHFNDKWHQIIAEKLFEYIKSNKLLDEKCY